ncbi:MAG TPA: efflux transporter outer membrane subunit [Xanthobacteraceae bacterium]|nr:efflux transporter outer membrane subunit [Xanthobacteraceae bacterium]
MQILTACNLTFGLTRDHLDPELEVPKSYRESNASANAALPTLEWWRAFKSSELTGLMEQAQIANLDIAAAVARISEADAQARIAGAALLPTITGNANASHTSRTVAASTAGAGIAATDGTGVTSVSTGSGVNRSSLLATLNASYQLDFWGRNRALLRAAEESAVASRFDREVVALSTLVSVANAYFLVLEAQDRLKVANENLTAAERILRLVEDRFKSGTAAALDVAQQASVVAIQRASIPPLIVVVKQNMATLALLIGRAPESVRIRGGSMFQLAVPRVTPGIPSNVLTRRPDIREAEAKLVSADANVEAARAAFFPNIQLTGQAGFQSAVLRTLFGPGAAFYTVAASLAQPIFDGGQLLGQLDLQSATRVELLQNYRKAVISAFTDVEKALIAVQQTTRQEQLQRDAVNQARRAFELSEERLRAGTIDLTTLLTTEQTLFQQEDVLAQVRFARLQAAVTLYQALGGGWQMEDKPIQRADIAGRPRIQ